MPKGGLRLGAGRPLGSTNKLDRELREELSKTGELPVEYMIRVMRDERVATSRRDAMAIAAAPFLHHRLATVTLEGNPEKPLEQRVLGGMTLQEASQAYAETLRGNGSIPRLKLVRK